MTPATLIGGAVLSIGLGSFGALGWALRRLALLDRAIDAGDVVVLGVFAAFGSICVALGWLLLRDRSVPQVEVVSVEERRVRRVTLSQAVAAGGVLLLMLSVLLPAQAYPVVLLFAGLALLAVSHVLTPCEERLAKLRRARASLRQL